MKKGASDLDPLDNDHAERQPDRMPPAEPVAGPGDLNPRERIGPIMSDANAAGWNRDRFGPGAVAQLLEALSHHYRHSPLVHEDHAGSVYFRNEARHPSFVDCQAFSDGPRAGDRAPDVPILPDPNESGTPDSRLYDLMRDQQYTLLLFEGTHRARGSVPVWTAMRALLRQIQDSGSQLIQPVVVIPRTQRPRSFRWNGIVVHDGEGTFHHRYGARGECLYLIRPDGFIAYRSEPIDPGKFAAYLSRVQTAAH
jgi:hypothetical protein